MANGDSNLSQGGRVPVHLSNRSGAVPVYESTDSNAMAVFYAPTGTLSGGGSMPIRVVSRLVGGSMPVRFGAGSTPPPAPPVVISNLVDESSNQLTDESANPFIQD